MSQRVGQIYVCIKDHSLWKKLYKIEIRDDWWLNAKTGREIFENVQGNVWYIDGEWSPEFGDGFVWLSGLGRFIHLLQEKLGYNNCVILGSLTDINTDPVQWIYYCLGSYPKQRSVRGICGGPNICDTEAWVKWARINLKPKELRHLAGFKEMTDFVNRVSPVKRTAGSKADERRGRLFVSVKEPSQWEKAASLKLSDASFGFPKDISRRLSETSGYDFILNDDWHIDYGDSAFEFPLKKAVSKLKQKLGGKECVILAECADPNVSPVYKVACCLDGSLTFKEVMAPLSNVEINDVEAWLRLAGFQFSKKKREYMQEFPSSVFDFAKPSGAKKGSDGKGQAAMNDI